MDSEPSDSLHDSNRVYTMVPARFFSLPGWLAALVCVFCSSVTLAQAPSAPSQDPAAAAGAEEVLPESSNQYIIGPGDMLQVFVWRNPELSSTVPVRPDGKISTPLVENMVAVGKTPSTLARDMESVLGEFVRSPKVSVIVTTPVSTFSQVKIIGQVARPQAIAFREGMTVLDAVLAVGGVGEFAAPNRAKVVRQEGSKQKEIRVRLGDMLNGGDMKQNVLLKPGDVLVIPQSRF
jgi:polysaccharide biosynthesis/export protein